MTLSGSSGGTTTTDGLGNYNFTVLAGGDYTVTPSKAGRAPTSNGIDTVDVLALQRHFLMMGAPLSGCRFTAADVNLNGLVNTQDVIAVQRFFLGFTTGIAEVGKYQFSPINRSYSPLTIDQTNQNYDAIVFGDVASPFAIP